MSAMPGAAWKLPRSWAHLLGPPRQCYVWMRTNALITLFFFLLWSAPAEVQLGQEGVKGLPGIHAMHSWDDSHDGSDIVHCDHY